MHTTAYPPAAPQGRTLAFIDEAGQRSRTPKSSDHFVMSAALIDDEHLDEASECLAKLRVDLGRRPGDHLTWKNLHGHSLRLHAFIGAGVLSGTMISFDEWMERWIEQMERANEDLGSAFRAALRQASENSPGSRPAEWCMSRPPRDPVSAG
ncbi:DUF3800 domain-containing protein [Spirillospora sp. CA-128828]|uniref:DUF3800 domain-containing protein n=1 Tax=Spirillospora sp. CA-128828 TaxID=3240033 RepID=UPI003D93D11C